MTIPSHVAVIGYDSVCTGYVRASPFPGLSVFFLIDHLEETHSSDRDYYLDLATLEMLEEQGAAETLVQLLHRALGERKGMEVRWEEAPGG